MLVLGLTVAAASAAYFASRYLQRHRGIAAGREFGEQTGSRHASVMLPRIAFAELCSPAQAGSEKRREAIPPRIMAVIAETVTAVCGKDARVLSVKKMDATALAQPPAQMLSAQRQAWTQEGRVLIYASHEFVQGRTPVARTVPSLRGVLLEAADCD
jgi:hypothetical protein